MTSDQTHEFRFASVHWQVIDFKTAVFVDQLFDKVVRLFSPALLRQKTILRRSTHNIFEQCIAVTVQVLCDLFGQQFANIRVVFHSRCHVGQWRWFGGDPLLGRAFSLNRGHGVGIEQSGIYLMIRWPGFVV